MFEFLFKRPGDKPGDPPAGLAGQAEPQEPSAQGTQRALQAERLRALGGDEAAAVEFLLQSDYAELRLAAAEFVRSPAQLERVHAAIRNTDRRVAKLMQARLDAFRHHEAELRRAQTTIEQAEALVRDAMLTPNHVAELDRKWSVIAAPELAGAFDTVRAVLTQRLGAQVLLQRAMIDRLSALRQLEASSLPAAELAILLEQMAQDQTAALAAPEHASLPRSLITEFSERHARLCAGLHALDQAQAALAAREAALDQWQQATPGSLQPEALRKAWHSMPPAPATDAAALVQRRFDELLASLPQVTGKPKAAAPAAPAKPPRGADQHFLETLDAMEAALEQGSLGTAAELDKTLKESKGEGKGMRLTPAQSERLAHARSELKRLSDWARWGGNVSREELIKAVEQLPAQKLAMSELAKKVGSMRERWKALDSLAGAAPKSLWERFDAACGAAYAPAAAHFRHLADERHSNAAKAEALVAEANAAVAQLDQSGAVDWKHMATVVQRLRLGWSHLGAIDRKEKKRLDRQFADALNTLQGPLEVQRKTEVAVREALIDEVAALDAHDRHALDLLRALQQRWQEHARALPLERKAEQALWQRFRAACDAVFARRKESAHAADLERRGHEAAKEAVCARLEAAASSVEPGAAGALLRAAAADWHAIGAVPRAHEARLEQRYHAAIAAVQHHADSVRRTAALALAGALRDKLHLCQALEVALAGAPAQQEDQAGWSARWAALPALAPEYERTLKARFDAALAALADQGNGRDAYVKLLENQRAQLLHEVLRLELAAGIDSGSEFARERLKLQVEVLRSSLKSGQKATPQAGMLLALCAIAALTDARTASRIDHLLVRLAGEAK